MAGIGLSGLASGVDTNSIVSQLMALERQSITRLKLRETAAQARDTGLKDVKRLLQTLSTAANDLKSPSLWADIQDIASSNSAQVTGTRTTGATAGTYTVAVSRLATVEQKTFNYTARNQATTMTIGGISVSVAANGTVNDAAAAINATANVPVTASVVNGKLQLDSKTSGAVGAFTASGTQLAEDTALRRVGVDAAFTVNGVAKTSSTNVSETGIAGMSLALKAVTGATPVTLTVGESKQNTAAITGKIKAFVDAYNNVLSTVRAKTTEKKIPDADTTSEASKGALFGDRGLTAIVSSLRSTISETVAGNPGTLDQLSEIGISVPGAGGTVSEDAKLGKLVFDEAKFTAAMALDKASVQRMWSGATGSPGFAEKISTLVTANTGSDGSLTKRSESTTRDVERIRKQVAATDLRLVDREKRLRAEFAAMEKAMNAAQTQQSWLSGQLLSLNR